MESISIKTSSKYQVIFSNQWFDKLNELSINNQLIIITDSNLFKIYNNELSCFEVVIIEPGEDSKSIKTYEYVIEKLIDYNFDRNLFIVGFGGGVVCDLTGFIASTYMRGVKFGFISTSLLSMVDASVGGKTAINFKGIKNLLGVFTQPEFVYVSVDFLDTLPYDEYLNGFGEIIKHIILENPKKLEFLKNNISKIKAKDKIFLKEIIFESIKFKSSIVSKDEKEKGIRKILNYGHTLGHAIEMYYGIKHGISVINGIYLLNKWSSLKFNYINKHEKILLQILKDLKINLIENVDDECLNLIIYDKKSSVNNISIIYLDKNDKVGIYEHDKIKFIDEIKNMC